MRTRTFLATALWIAVLTASHAAAAPPSHTYCNSCLDCDAKLSSGSWTLVILTTDITDHAGHCIRLFSDVNDVTFDCDGHTIDGDDLAIDPEYGMYMGGGTGNEIKNCTISDFSTGIFLLSTTAHTVASNTLVSNNVGIHLSDSNSTDVYDNVSQENYTGIYFDNSDNNTASSNRACHNTNKDFAVYVSTGNIGTGNVCDVPDGWNDNKITGCSWSCGVFDDDFESGNSGSWSSTVS